jgi:hypothetical protein
MHTRAAPFDLAIQQRPDLSLIRQNLLLFGLDRFLIGEQRVELLLIGFDDLLVLFDDLLIFDDRVEIGDHFIRGHKIAPFNREWIDDSSTKSLGGAQSNVTNHRFFISRHFV